MSVVCFKNSEYFHQSVWDFFPQTYLLREVNGFSDAKSRKKINGKKIELHEIEIKPER
jgi:hypothetical protein